MNLLVTGANGFLGHRLVRKMIANGDQVAALGRSNPNIDGLEFQSADVTDKSSLDIFRDKKFDCLVHMAASVPKSKSDDVREVMLANNVQGTVNVIESFKDRIGAVVYASTVEVYGHPITDISITEDLDTKPQSNYGESKLTGEEFCSHFGEDMDIPITTLRFGVMYGEGDTLDRAIPNFIRQAVAGSSLKVFGGEELRDYLYVDDAVVATSLAIEKPANSVLNIATGTGISVLKVAQIIAKAVNPDLSIDVLPRKKPMTNLVLDISRAEQLLGFKTKYQFPDKLDELIKWQRENQ